MKFEATKCDECGRIQGEMNHWIKVAVHKVDNGVVLVALGDVKEGFSISRGYEAAGSEWATEFRDLCGQHCAYRHLAKQLGWTVQTEAEAGS